MPGPGRTRRQSDRRDHRQPKRQERRKRGASIDPPGYDAGKSPQRGALSAEIKGKKRHVLVDTQGLLLCAIVHAADIQDRDGGVLLMSALFGMFPFLLKLYADSGYLPPDQSGDRQALGRGQVRRSAQALDRRANHRLAQPVSPTG